MKTEKFKETMNYFQRIIDLFSTHDTSERGKEMFYRWLVDEKHTSEKDNALKKVWDGATGKASNKTRQSFKEVEMKAGIAPKRNLRSLRFWQTAAAVLFIISLSSIYFYTTKNTSDLIEHYVPTAELRLLTLPDGSEVQLNSGSVLLYPEAFDGKSRSVYLTGEANFKVKRNQKKPFIVKSSGFQVTVLGTEFNVSAYPEDSTISATVLSGSVKVEYGNLQTGSVLSPNQQLAYNKFTNRHTLCSPDMHDVTAWQRGELVFKGTTLRDIITVLERKYPYEFTYSLAHLTGDKYTFRFGDKDTLPEVMDVIVRVVGNLNYKIENNTCRIY